MTELAQFRGANTSVIQFSKTVRSCLRKTVKSRFSFQPLMVNRSNFSAFALCLEHRIDASFLFVCLKFTYFFPENFLCRDWLLGIQSNKKI